jgi:hypothetical protein
VLVLFQLTAPCLPRPGTHPALSSAPFSVFRKFLGSIKRRPRTESVSASASSSSSLAGAGAAVAAASGGGGGGSDAGFLSSSGGGSASSGVFRRMLSKKVSREPGALLASAGISAPLPGAHPLASRELVLRVPAGKVAAAASPAAPLAPFVAAGTVPALLQYLVGEGRRDLPFTRHFLVCHANFITSDDLLAHLREVYLASAAAPHTRSTVLWILCWCGFGGARSSPFSLSLSLAC